MNIKELLEKIQAHKEPYLQIDDLYFTKLTDDDFKRLNDALEQNTILQELRISKVTADIQVFKILSRGISPKVKIFKLCLDSATNQHSNFRFDSFGGADRYGGAPSVSKCTYTDIENIILRNPSLRRMELGRAFDRDTTDEKFYRVTPDGDMVNFQDRLFRERKYVNIDCEVTRKGLAAERRQLLASASNVLILRESWERQHPSRIELIPPAKTPGFNFDSISWGITELRIIFTSVSVPFNPAVFAEVKQICITGCSALDMFLKDLVAKIFPACCVLSEIVIRNCGLKNNDVGIMLDYLIAHPESCPEHLDLSGNELTDGISEKVVKLFAVSKKNITLKLLPQNNTAPENLKQLLLFQQLSLLKVALASKPQEFNIEPNMATKFVLEFLLRESTIFAKVKKIYVDGHDSQQRIAPAAFNFLISKVLSICPNLSEITFTACGLTDEMGHVLLDYLIGHPEVILTQLNLSGNELTDGVSEKVVKLLAGSKTNITLKLLPQNNTASENLKQLLLFQQLSLLKVALASKPQEFNIEPNMATKFVLEFLLREPTIFAKVKKIYVDGHDSQQRIAPAAFNFLISKVLSICPNLSEITFTACGLTDEMGHVLLDYLIGYPEAILTQLNLSGNELTDGISGKIEKLCTVSKRIFDLNLSQKTLPEHQTQLASLQQKIEQKLECIQYIGDLKSRLVSNPLELEIVPNYIVPFVMELLSRDMTIFAKVRRIRINDAEIKYDAIVFLTTTLLPACHDLSDLVITKCGLTDEMGISLLDYLINNPTNCPARLDLSNNALTDKVASKIAELLKRSNVLTVIKLDDNHVMESDTARALLGDAFKQNRTLVSFSCFRTLVTTLSYTSLGVRYASGGINLQQISGFVDDINSNRTLLELKLYVHTLLKDPHQWSGSFQTDRVFSDQERAIDKLNSDHTREINKFIKRNGKGQMFLLSYVTSENISEMNRILSSGMSMYTYDLSDGNSLLHIAVEQNKPLSVQYFLSQRFNKRFTNHAGKTARDLVSATTFPEIVSMLDSDQIPLPPQGVSLAAAAAIGGRVSKGGAASSRGGRGKFSQQPHVQAGPMDRMLASLSTAPKRVSDSTASVGNVGAVNGNGVSDVDRSPSPKKAKMADEFQDVSGVGATTSPPPPQSIPPLTAISAQSPMSSTTASTLQPPAPAVASLAALLPQPMVLSSSVQSAGSTESAPQVPQTPQMLQVSVHPEFSADRNLPYFMALNGNSEFFVGLPQDFDIDQQYQNGCTVFHAAALYGHSELISYLLERCADSKTSLNVRDNLGRTSLHYACLLADRDSYQTYKVVEMLLANSVDVDAQDMYGMTPLYLLAGGFDAQMNRDVESPNLKLVARLLIGVGANVNLIVNDLELNVANFSLLHKAVYKGNYHMVSVLLSAATLSPNARPCDLTILDAKGNSVFHVAALYGHAEIFERMMQWPDARRICDMPNKEGKSVATIIEDLKQIPNQSPELKGHIIKLDEIYRSFVQHLYPAPVSGSIWVKSSTCFYGSRNPDKRLECKFDDLHSSLAQSIDQQRPAFVRGGAGAASAPGNRVAAALTFIVSTQPHNMENKATNQRICITIKLTDGGYQHVSDFWQQQEYVGDRRRSPDTRDAVVRRLRGLPADFQLVSDISDRRHALTPEAVERLYQSPETVNPTFEQLFHHSEQALLSYLEQLENITKIVGALKQDPHFVEGCKVYAAILHLYTPNYVCKNCEPSLIGEQSSQQSLFLANLRKVLLKEGCVIARDDHLSMLTFVSSKIPDRVSGMEKKKLDDHCDWQIDLRFDQGRLLLQRDLESTAQQPTVFGSRKGQY